MPTYTYETIDSSRPIRTFEVTQSIHDDALSKDPATGEPARRVVSRGYQIHVRGKSTGPSVGSVGGE